MLIYENCFYNAVTLPVYGIYGDYGRIEEIKKDHNVFTIESYFKKPIERITDPIEEQTPPIDSGMFVLKEIYDELAANTIDEFGQPLDFHFSSIRKCYKQFKNQLNQTAKLFYSFPTSAVTKPTQPAFSEIIETFKNHHVEFFAFKDYKTFMKIYWQQIYFGNLQQEFRDFRNFISGLHATNNFLFPAMNGYQFGNDYMSHTLARKIHNITYKRRTKCNNSTP
jgi:hypothetical protein